MRWFGPISSEWTPPVDGVSSTLDEAENPVRDAFMLIARIEPVFTSPNTRSPLTEAPNPHARQNASPVVPMGGGRWGLGGRRGFGPLLFVSPGAVPPQFSLAPQP